MAYHWEDNWQGNLNDEDRQLYKMLLCSSISRSDKLTARNIAYNIYGTNVYMSNALESLIKSNAGQLVRATGVEYAGSDNLDIPTLERTYRFIGDLLELVSDMDAEDNEYRDSKYEAFQADKSNRPGIVANDFAEWSEESGFMNMCRALQSGVPVEDIIC